MFIRSAAELDGGKWACGAVWISQQLLHWDANRHYSNRIRVRLIKHCPQTLDGFSCCQGGIQGVNRLTKNIDRAFQCARQNKKIKIQVFSGTRISVLLCLQNICTVNTCQNSFKQYEYKAFGWKVQVCWMWLTLASRTTVEAISSVRRTSSVLMAPLAVKSKRNLSGATKEPRWSASPSTERKA